MASSSGVGDKRPRVAWKDEIDKTFLETCIAEVSRVGRSGASLKTSSWDVVVNELKVRHNLDVIQRQCKNHYDYLKEKYQQWVPISGKTGNVYDPITNTINWTDAEWKEYIKGHPKASILRNSPLPHPYLCTQLFDGAAAKGDGAWGPAAHVSRHNSSSANSQNLGLLGTEENPSEDDETSLPSPGTQSHASNAPSRPNPTSQAQKPNVTSGRSKKKSRRNDSHLAAVCEEMSSVMKVLMKNNDGPSYDECVEKLDKLGWDTNDPMYTTAIGCFCEAPSYRVSWMRLKDDDKELIEGWVRRMGKKFGLL